MSRNVSQQFSLRQLFSLLFLLFVGLLAATALQAWTGPTATAPDGNVSAPINVGSGTQTKVGGLLNVYDFWVNDAMGIAGGMTVGGKVGVDLPSNSSPVVPLDVNGTIIVGNSGEVCQAVTAGAVRYNASTNNLEYCNGTAWTAVGASSSGGVDYQEFTSSGTYSKPAGTTLVVVEAWGGGGGGGYGLSNQYGNIGGPGGGGGACVNATLRGNDVGNTVAVTIGAGGSGGVSSSPSGYSTSGGNTSFGSLIAAYGGGGAGYSLPGGGGGGALSAGTTAAAGSPDGGAPGGGNGYYGGGGGGGGAIAGGESYCGGGGGGGGGNTASYGNAGPASGGISALGGAGGAGSAPGHNGVAGTAPGGGGGGTSGGAVGGAGARGEVRVWSFTGTGQ